MRPLNLFDAKIGDLWAVRFRYHTRQRWLGAHVKTKRCSTATAARQLSYGLQKRCEVPEHFNFSDKFQYWIRWFVMRGQVLVIFSVGVFVSFAFLDTIAIKGFQTSPLQSTFCLVNGNLIGNAFETMMQYPCQYFFINCTWNLMIFYFLKDNQ